MATSLEFWFRRKYSLAPTDPRFLEATVDQMLTDYWAWYRHEKPSEEEMEDDDFDQEAVLAAMADQAAWEDLIADVPRT